MLVYRELPDAKSTHAHEGRHSPMRLIHHLIREAVTGPIDAWQIAATTGGYQ
jgi:hypothetical protein